MSGVAATLAAIEIGSPLKRGSLHLFPLFSDLPAASSYLTGPGATAKGVLRPEEMVSGAVVEALEIRNTGVSALLLLDGETLLGGDQNRCVNVSLLCPPRSVTIVSVSCVEAGRWGGRRETTRSSRVTPGTLRAHNRTAVVRGARPGAEILGDQQAVWSDIHRLTESLHVTTSTSSMEDVYSATNQQVEGLVGGTSPQPGQRGVAAFVSGELLALDLFDTPQTMTDYWSGLVAGYALDALARSARQRAPAPGSIGPGRDCRGGGHRGAQSGAGRDLTPARRHGIRHCCQPVGRARPPLRRPDRRHLIGSPIR